MVVMEATQASHCCSASCTSGRLPICGGFSLNSSFAAPALLRATLRNPARSRFSLVCSSLTRRLKPSAMATKVACSCVTSLCSCSSSTSHVRSSVSSASTFTSDTPNRWNRASSRM
jgi:hypothetical protein